MSELKKLEKKVRDSLEERLSKSEYEYYKKKAEVDLIKWVVAILKPLGQRKITFKEAIKSIKQELEIRFKTPSTDSIFTVEDELIKKEVIYLKVLKIMREYFKQMIFDADEKERKITLDKTYPDYFEEIFNKINIELYNHLERKKWVGVFHSQDHYEAFLHVLKSFLIEEHNKTLFMGFYREYGGNKVLMRCNEKNWREWVNEHYLIKGEDSSKRWNECPQHHYTRKQIRQSQKTYKDPTIFKEPAAR